MENRQSPVSKFDTAENLAARQKALAIWNSALVEEIPFEKVIEMIFHAQDSAKGSRAELQFEAERRILEEINESHNPDSLKEFRKLFDSRSFLVSDVQRWMDGDADLLEMTDDSLVEGYPEFVVSASPSNFRSSASLIETARRRFVDQNPDFADFISFYSDVGK